MGKSRHLWQRSANFAWFTQNPTSAFHTHGLLLMGPGVRQQEQQTDLGPDIRAAHYIILAIFHLRQCRPGVLAAAGVLIPR